MSRRLALIIPVIVLFVGGVFYLSNNLVSEIPQINSNSQIAAVSGANSLLLAYYTFDEGNGTTVRDASGNAYHGTVFTGTSSPEWVGGRVGGAISLDGQDDYVNIGSQAAFGNLDAITVSAWVYPKNSWTNPYGFISNLSYGSNTGFAFGGVWDGISSSRVLIGSKAIDFTGTVAPAVDRWTHITFTYDAIKNEVIFYKNSIPSTLKSGPGSRVAVSTQPFVIGKYLSQTFNGFIDEVRIYGRALSPEEIVSVYNHTGAQVDPSANNPVGDPATPNDTTPPSVPINLSSSGVTSSKATISWRDSADNVAVAGYKVFRNNVQISTVVSDTSYTDSGISAGATYLYRISAFDVKGNESAQSASVSVTTTGQSTTSFGTTEISLPRVLQGRQSYASQQIMWKDAQGHIHIINSFGGADVTGAEKTYIHYINTHTGAHALVEGGACSFGRASVYSPVHNKFYWYGEYCSRAHGGSFNEFDPVTMTNRVIKSGGSVWWTGMNTALGADNKIYFTAMHGNMAPARLYSYDPIVGPSSWTDLGVIYGPSNGIGPGLAIDTTHIYVAWQQHLSPFYWHLMVRPTVSSGSWKEISFKDAPNTNATGLRFFIDRTTKKWFATRTTEGTTKYYWLEGGMAVPVTGILPTSGAATESDLNMKHHISMMGYGNYGQFNAAFGYDMNWDNLIPHSGNPVSTVAYGPHGSWNYPTSGFNTSSLSYSGPFYDLPVSAIVPHVGSAFYVFGDAISYYDYSTQISTPVGTLPPTSVYFTLRVPATHSPLGVEEIYYSGYANQVWRWNPSVRTTSLQNNTNPIAVKRPLPMNYPVFMDYDSEGKIWIGANACGATSGCIDYGSVAWYNPVNHTSGEMFQGVWTGGNPPATGNGITFSNFAMSNNRTKLVVSAKDGNLTVINALTKTVEGTYPLNARAYMVEVAEDQVMGVTTTADPQGQRVFLFKPSDRTMILAPRSIRVSGSTFGTGDGHISRRNFKLELGPDGYAWLFVNKKIYRVNPQTLEFQYVVTDSSSSTKLIWAANKKDLLVYGGADTSYFPNLLNSNLPLPATIHNNVPKQVVVEEPATFFETLPSVSRPTIPSEGGGGGGGGGRNTPSSTNVPAVNSATIPSAGGGSSAYNLGTATLRDGSRGPAVMELQRFLNDTLNLGLVVDGILGPKTIAVIKQWQSDRNLVPDGLVGPKTKAVINGQTIPPTSGAPFIPSTTPIPSIPSAGSRYYNLGSVTLRDGSRGPAVVELQRFLNDTLNLGLVVDGILGPKTIAVIKQWQSVRNLVPDGLVGPKTKAMMNAGFVR